MANTLDLYARYDPGTGVDWQEIQDSEKIYFQKSGAFAYGSAGAIEVGSYNGGTHIIDASNNELCDTAHPSNVEYVTSSTCKINGGTEVNVTSITQNDCFRLTGTCSPEAEVTASSFFVYGSTETNPITDVTTYGVKQGDSAWSDVGGSANAYSLGTSPSGATHHKYFALTVTPTANGTKSGTLKCSMTFV